jgi:translation initiation factor 3 subunit E
MATSDNDGQEFDLTQTIAPFLDVHLMFPILAHLEESKLYPINDLLKAKLELLGPTNMPDYEIETHQQAYGTTSIPEQLEEKKTKVMEKLDALRSKAETLLNLIENDQDKVNQLRENENFNMGYLKANHGVTDGSLEALCNYAKEYFNTGNYEMSLYYLVHYVLLDDPVSSDAAFSAMWGKLACEILLCDWEQSWVDMKYIADAIDTENVSPLLTLERRAWLLHWGIFIFFNHKEGREYIVDFLFEKEKYMNALQIYCPWLLRYLAAAVVTNKRRRGSDMLRKVVRITQQEGYTYQDPITRFIESLYIEFNFQGAQEMLNECEKVFKCDFFLGPYREEFMEKSRLLIFETYCRIHEKINIDMLAEKLGTKQDEAERWVVDLIRNARLNAKINSEEKYVVMQAKYPSIYQQVMEKTKNLSYTTYVLADNLREFFTEAQQRAADEKVKREAEEQKLKEETEALKEKEAMERKLMEEEAAKKAAAKPKSVWGKP